mmetsp:Transcript_86233/g.171214  ORF Transcript_86233/g.171214 Transcript_86233/m.171214 type:complete len:97 (+) Transcript_86233:1029-1319(+)
MERMERKAKANGLVTVRIQRSEVAVAVIAENVVSETAVATEGGITTGTMSAVMAMAMVIAETVELEQGNVTATSNLGAAKRIVARVSWRRFEHAGD